MRRLVPWEIQDWFFRDKKNTGLVYMIKNGKITMVSGFDFPLNQSIEWEIQDFFLEFERLKAS